MRKSADARKLDKKHISPKTLKMLLAGNLTEALDRPDMQFLHAQAKERRRMLSDALEDPAFYLQPEEDQKKQLEEEAPPFQFGPAAPGSPQAPGTPQAPASLLGGQQGMEQIAGILGHFMNKMAEDEEGGATKLRPEQIQDLVNFIASQGQTIDDEKFHGKTEELGVNTHSAEAEMYRLISELVGGKNDVIAGGLAAGVPTEEFPADQIQKGTEVELEHTSNPAVAQEIAKDHLTEGDDYYDPRLEDLEKDMKSDVDSGKTDIPTEGNEKVEENEKQKKEDQSKLENEKAAAYKYGFLMKLAESGMRPSELEDNMMKRAGASPTGIIATIIKLLGGAAGGVASQAAGLGGQLLKFGIPGMAAILGGLGGTAYYDMTRPDDIKPEDVKRAERLALYKRLTSKAKSKTRKEEEPEDLDTESDDSHKKMLPATTGIEI